MAVEVRPLGVACNIKCHYCYQQPQRDAGGSAKEYDMEAMKAAVVRENSRFTLFGGEPLLVPLDDIEELWSWGWQKFGRNGIQTNGSLITEKHIKLFKKYNVGVGISIDGPGELNDVRWSGTLEGTRRATAKTEAAIRRLCEEGIPPSIIATLHRGNVVGDRLARLTEWFREIDTLGVKSARLHILEVDNPVVRQLYTLSLEENIAAFLHFAEVEKSLKKIRFDVFSDIRNLLMGRDERATCIWVGCDQSDTQAVRGVEGHGQRSNCGRTNKEGVDFVKASAPGFERYLALYHTPQEHNGCGGCEYFVMCKGQCPGTSIHSDWRNRSEHCLVWKELFAVCERQLLAEGKPVLSMGERAVLEQKFVEAWSAGTNTKMCLHVPEMRRQEEADMLAVVGESD
jgi:uncharacterized protein